MSTRVNKLFSTRADGDFSIAGTGLDLDQRRTGLVDLNWTWLHQTHGTNVVVVSKPGAQCGVEADAAVTSIAGAALAIQTADCAPVLLWGETSAGEPVIGAAHAGWRGLYDGILEHTVATMLALGSGSTISAVLGPCISPEAYEFQPAELTTMALRFGPDVVAATVNGSPAFDLPLAVRAECDRWGVSLGGHREDGGVDCTALAMADSAPRYFSYRARSDSGRQVSLIWIDGPAASSGLTRR